METPKEIMMSRSGLKALEDEYRELTTVKRTEIAEKLKEARSHGDLSENSEYDAAKNDQAIMEARIQQLESMLARVKILEEEDISTDHVSIGCRVKLYDEQFNEEATYTVVNVSEADVENNRISDESPIGRGLMGHRIGDEAVVTLPNGNKIRYKVLAIEMDRGTLN